MRLYEIENCKDLGTYDQKNQTQGFLPLDKKLYRKYIQNLDNIIRDSKRILMIAWTTVLKLLLIFKNISEQKKREYTRQFL